MREVVFDTETTGLRPDDGHRLVEIGCIEMIDRIETGNSFHCYFNPDRDMPPEAEEIHGLSAHFLSDKPRFAEQAAALLDFLGDAPLVAHNASFDFRFLNAELGACGLEPVSMTRMVDTVALARAKFPGSPVSLDALCARFGVDRSHRVKHGALLDAELLTQVYIELTGGRQIGLSLAGEGEDGPADGAGQHAALLQSVGNRPVRPPRPHRPSAEELERHRRYLDGFNQPLWLKSRVRALDGSY
ncbi:MAG: DNA polymerase III subunit epsilon [Blastomonas sp.]